MLVLTRRVGESVCVGKDVVIFALGVDGNQMKIGIEAPKDMEIIRSELVEGAKDGEEGTESTG